MERSARQRARPSWWPLMLVLPFLGSTACQRPTDWTDAAADGDADGDVAGDGDGDLDGDVDADADGDADAEETGDADEQDGEEPQVILDSPADGERFYRLQPITFVGWTPGPLAVEADAWPIGGTDQAGDFEVTYAFSGEGVRRIAFLVGGEEQLAISLTIEPNLARVCLSPGHPTSTGDKLFEALINRKVAFFLEDHLSAAGYEVLNVVDDLSREELFAEDFDNEGAAEQSMLEVYSLGYRADTCNDWAADYFISIHHNAVDDSSPNYTLTIYGESASGSPRFPDAVTWAELTTDALLGTMTVTAGHVWGDRSALGFGLSVLQNTEMIGILTEGSFYSNPEERARLNDNAYLAGEADAIFEGFIAFAEG